MTLSHVFVVRCALVTVPLLLAGCSTADDSAPTPVAETTETPAPATTADAEQQATEQALAVVPIYWQTVDGLFSDPTLPIDGLYAVAVDPEATAEAAAIQSFRSNGYTQSGTSQVVGTSVGAVDLETTGAADDLPSVQVTACIDVSQVDATDAGGASVVAADRAPYLVSDLTIVNIAYPDAASWRVSSAPNTQAQACPG